MVKFFAKIIRKSRPTLSLNTRAGKAAPHL